MNTKTTKSRKTSFAPMALALISLCGTAAISTAQNVAEVPSSLAPAPSTTNQDPKPNDASTLNQINFETGGVEFGEVLDDKPVEMEFAFSITGVHPLRIKRVQTSCGCTAADVVIKTRDESGEMVEKLIASEDLANHLLEPGTEGVLRATFDPTGRPGVQHKRITIHSTDTYKPSQILKVTGTVRQIISMDPPVLGFGSLAKGQGGESKVIVAGLAEDFAIQTPAFSTPGVFTAEVTPLGERMIKGVKMQAAEVTVRMNEGVKPGRHNAKMVIRTNDPRKPVVDMPVYADVMGDVEVSPARVSFGLVRVGDSLARDLRISHRKGDAFEITSAEVLASGMTIDAKVTPVDESKTQWKIELSGTADEAQLRQSGTIRLHTNVEDEGVIEIPLMAVVREKQ